MKAICSIYFFLCSIFLFSSCSTEVENTIQGWWTIDNVYYKNEDVLTSLSSNSIFFKEENCQFPSLNNNISRSNGVWSLINSGNAQILKVTTSDKAFTGNYKVSFEEDQKNKLLKMNLTSETVSIKCTKGLFNFDRNKGLIERLIKNNVSFIQAIIYLHKRHCALFQ